MARKFKRTRFVTRAIAVALLLAGIGSGYWYMTPEVNSVVRFDVDRGQNAIWLQHGWLGDDRWFVENRRDKALFRSEARVGALADRMAAHHVTDLFPHLCPCSSDGRVAVVDDDQVELFLRVLEIHEADFRVIPWVGGVLGRHAFPESSQWRANFVESVRVLLETHPSLSGIHVNIEPMPPDNEHFLTLLRELSASLPEDNLLSVAAYPPPTVLHPYHEVHWDEEYFRAVSREADQVAVMLYDTALRNDGPYIRLLSRWIQESLDWGGDTMVLLGLPAYDDSGVGYHIPEVENLENGLRGAFAGLSEHERIPQNYQGVALYSEWEMDDQEWSLMRQRFVDRN